MGKFLVHAIRRQLENLMNSSLLKPLKPRNVRVKEHLGDITKNRYSSLIISDNSWESSGNTKADIKAPT